MSVPKRGHYGPQIILNGFADAEGWLFWCKHRGKPTMVRRARPAELFLQNHLYSTLAESGIKDPSMERALWGLESEAVGVIDAITGPARRGQSPVLSQRQMRLWYLFFLMRWRRTPENLDYEATAYLTDPSHRLLTLPPPAGLAEEMAQLEAGAQLIVARLIEEVSALEPGLVSAAKDFTEAELTQIRTMEDTTDGTRRKLLNLLKQTPGSFILQSQELGRRAPMLLRDTMGQFAFCYSLCMLLYYMEWVRIGRQTGKKLPLRVNDVVDMRLAAMGTYFSGVLSADGNLQIVSNTARGVLRGFGAYVGEDWRVPQPPQETRTDPACQNCGAGARAEPPAETWQSPPAQFTPFVAPQADVCFRNALARTCQSATGRFSVDLRCRSSNR